MALKQNYSGWWPKYVMDLEVKLSRFWMNTLRLPLAAIGDAYSNSNSIKGHLIASNKLSFDLISFGVCACVLSCFSQIWLFLTPWTAACGAPLPMIFSLQEYWSGWPFPSPVHESEKWKWSLSVMSDPTDCSPPGSSVHGILQARALEWGAIAFSSYLEKR